MSHLPAICRMGLVALVALLGLGACTAPDREGALDTAIMPRNVENLSQVALWETGAVDEAPEYYYYGLHHGISCLAFSPDGQFLASGDSDGMVRMRRTADGADVWKHREEWAAVTSIAFSPDGALVVTGTSANDSKMCLWRASDGELLQTLDYPGEWGAGIMAFSPDGSTLASWGLTSPIYLWRVQDWTLLRTLEYPADKEPFMVGSLAFAPDGQTMVAAMYTWAGIWRLSDGALVHTIKPDDGAAQANFRPDAQTVALIAARSFYLWRPNDGGLERHDLKYPSGYARGGGEIYIGTNWETGSYTPNRQLFAASTDDWAIWLWRVRDWKPVRKLTGHTARISGVVFSPDGTLMASGSEDGTIRIWGIR